MCPRERRVGAVVARRRRAPPVAAAVHVIVVPAATGNARFAVSDCTTGKEAAAIVKFPVARYASYTAVDPAFRTHTCRSYCPVSAEPVTHVYVGSGL